MNTVKYAPYIVLISLLFHLTAASAAEHDFWISPSGSDVNPGTQDKPFASLDKARLAVRDLKKTKQGDISVGLKGGKYRLTDTVVFTKEDSGSPIQKVSYEAADGEAPVLTSAKPVEGWTRVDKPQQIFLLGQRANSGVLHSQWVPEE